MSNPCIYYVEGECEERFLAAMKLQPAKLIPGRVRVFNIVQNLIPKSQILEIPQGSIIALAFDTDVTKTDFIQKNVERLKQYCRRVRVVYLPQVLDFEDELVRNTDIREIRELTKSSTNKEFKRDFCRMKDQTCRQTLEHHHLNMDQMWDAPLPENFRFIEKNSRLIKL